MHKTIHILSLLTIFIITISIRAEAVQISSYNIDTQKLNTVVISIFGNNTDLQSMVDIISYGKTGDYLREISDKIKEDFLLLLIDNKRFMYTILLLIFVSACITMTEGDETKLTDGYINISVSVILLLMFANLYKTATKTAESLFTVTKSALPFYLGFSLNSASNTFVNTFFTIYMVGFQWLSEKILFPMVLFSVIFSILDNCSGLNCTSFRKGLITTANWFMGIYTTLFLSFIRMSGAAAFSTGSAVYGGIKFTVAKGIPVVGGYVSETLDTFIAGLGIVKSSLGIITSSAILILCVSPVAYILITGFVLNLISHISSVFGLKASSGLIGDISACVTEIAVILLVCSIGFVSAFSMMLS